MSSSYDPVERWTLDHELRMLEHRIEMKVFNVVMGAIFGGLLLASAVIVLIMCTLESRGVL